MSNLNNKILAEPLPRLVCHNGIMIPCELCKAESQNGICDDCELESARSRHSVIDTQWADTEFGVEVEQ